MASLAPIRERDLVECDVRGRVFLAEVTERRSRKLGIRPLSAGVGYFEVTARQVKKHYRLTKNTG